MSTINKLTAAGALLGDEAVELSVKSTTITITATTISALGSDNSYNDSGGGLVLAGFAVDDYVNVAGYTGTLVNNIYSAKITALTGSKMSIGGADGAVIIDAAAGDSVTVSKWVSRRSTAQEIADRASSAGGGGSPITYTIDTGSTADSDPGAGLLKFNNASQAAATMIYIDNATADAVTLTTLLASLAQTGFLTLVQADDPTYWRIYKITAVTSASGYYKLTVVNQAGSASDFADAVSVLVTFDSDANTGTFTGGTLTSSINEAPAVTIASASTVNIGAAAANTINVTGTTTITAFDSIADGALRRLIFGGILTLTHNGTSLILPTAANITTAAGDSAVFLSLGSGNWRCVGYQRASGSALTGSGSTQGKQSIPINAGGMRGATTNGCAPLAQLEISAGQPEVLTLDFDPAAIEYAWFSIPMPKKWNEGTITARFIWSHAATTTNFAVVWALQAVSVSDDDAIGASYGTAQTVTDTGGTTNDLYSSAETSAITIAGTPAAEDTVFFRAYRDATNGSDTLAVDARLHAVVLYITTDADTDA